MTTSGLDPDGCVPGTAVAGRRSSFDELLGVGRLLHWVESVPWTGRSQVMSWSAASGCEVSDVAVGSTLHAYGGGVYTVTDGGMWVVHAGSGRAGPLGTALLPPGVPGADGDLAWAAGLVWVVRDVDTHDLLLAIDPASGVGTAVREAPFLGAPRLGAGRLAWMQWAADVMPWDGAEIWVADVGAGPSLSGALRVAGGSGESAVQPEWGPGGWLYFVSDRSGWWNLYRWNGGAPEAIAPLPGECAQAPWEAGYRSYAFLPGDRVGFIAQQGPYHRLAVADYGTVTWLDTPFTSMKPYLAAYGDRLAVIGASPVHGQQVALVATDGSGDIEVIRESAPPVEVAGRIAEPQVLRVAAPGGQITAIVYQPAVAGPAPLIVRVHPGPTHHSELRLDWEVQYLTSRGFAVVDVDYRGSTGYGRTFRKALDGAWGIADVEDCTAVARHLIAGGSVLPQAVFIAGASAGGYTALRAVSRPDTPFALAAARSAIVDPTRWQNTAPRFQRPHAAILSHGRAVDPREVRRPVLLIHGAADPIAPIGDVIDLAQALEGRGLLTGLIEFPYAGHDLTGDALVHTLEAEYAAYRQVLMQVT